MKAYQDLLTHILTNGTDKGDRTGTGTRSVFGYQMRFNLEEGFPLLTTKDMGGPRWEGIKRELKWFLDGNTDLSYLLEHSINIWNPDAYRDYKSKGGTKDIHDFLMDVFDYGYDLGPIYGKQWRSWSGIDDGNEYTLDQISSVIEEIKANPDSRRLLVSAWRPDQIHAMALPPCHVLFQFYVVDGKLSCQLYQRSGDVFLGVPYNIASYALLTHMVAHVTGLGVGEFIHTLGDAHIYNNHLTQCQEQVSREPKPLPTLVIGRNVKHIDDFEPEDFTLNGYDPHPAIKGKVSVGQ